MCQWEQKLRLRAEYEETTSRQRVRGTGEHSTARSVTIAYGMSRKTCKEANNQCVSTFQQFRPMKDFFAQGYRQAILPKPAPKRNNAMPQRMERRFMQNELHREGLFAPVPSIPEFGKTPKYHPPHRGC